MQEENKKEQMMNWNYLMDLVKNWNLENYDMEIVSDDLVDTEDQDYEEPEVCDYIMTDTSIIC